jgi:hypothetical protein
MCKFNKPTVILTSKLQILNDINKCGRLTNILPKNFKFLIYCEESNLINTQLKLPAFDFTRLQKGHMTLNEYFLIPSRDSVELLTIRYFSESACNKPQLVKIDTFEKSTQIWTKSLKDHDNSRNFHGCLLSFGATFSFQFYFENQVHNPRTQTNRKNYIKKVHQSNNLENIQYGGMIYEVVEMMAKTANFTPYYQVILENAVVPRNNYMHKQYFDILLSEIKGTHILRYDLTVPFLHFGRHFLVTPNELYLNYEKLLLPFDLAIWILLFLTFSFVFGIIFTINRMSRRIQDFLYGEGVNVPAYNALGTFFGIPQTRLPVRSFPRFLLVSFIIFCLVFRTAYQGVMFEFITTDMRKTTPESKDAAFDRNYSLIFIEYSFKGNQSHSRRLRLDNDKR